MANFAPGAALWRTLPDTVHCSCLASNWYRHLANFFEIQRHVRLWPWYKIWSHPQNQKYVTYRNAVKEGWSHGPTEACRKNLVKFGRVVFELCQQTDRQTDILITILCASAGGKVTINSRQKIAHESNLRWSSGNSLNNRKFSNAIVQHMTKSPFLQTKSITSASTKLLIIFNLLSTIDKFTYINHANKIITYYLLHAIQYNRNNGQIKIIKFGRYFLCSTSCDF